MHERLTETKVYTNLKQWGNVGSTAIFKSIKFVIAPRKTVARGGEVNKSTNVAVFDKWKARKRNGMTDYFLI